MRYRDLFILAAGIALLSACSGVPERSPGGVSQGQNPTSVGALAQTARDQGQGTLSGQVNAANTNNAHTFNLWGVQQGTVSINPDGTTRVEVVGPDASAPGGFSIHGEANFGARFGDDGQHADADSGSQGSAGQGGANVQENNEALRALLESRRPATAPTEGQ